tara:strand:- start:1721 stop:3217 length:1497 start_codon:yes stop_codon:yes gene_type:complete
MKTEHKIIVYILAIFSHLNSQQILNADPFNLLINENNNAIKEDYSYSFLLRPYFFKSYDNRWSLIITNEYFYNDNTPNLENMGNKWLGKGSAIFSGLNLSYISEYFYFSLEPYYYFNENHFVKNTKRPATQNADPDVFNVLNDNRYFHENPYISYGLRESSFILKFKNIGIGISNSNMWWGPGIHTSLTMTNNTSGFPYFLISSIDEKRIKNVGIDFRYIFTRLNKNIGNPYYTAFVFTTRFYTQPIFSIGFSRNYLSGGIYSDGSFSGIDAAILPFELLFIDSKIDKNSNGFSGHDYWDQTLVGFAVMEFPRSKLKLFIEIGTDDHRQNWSDLRSHPDHNAASIIGMRKYGLFNNKMLISGFEYANIKKTYTSRFRGGGHWWWKDGYEYSSYDGRRWAAHSGSDSDDFYYYFGYNKDDLILISGFNYERHGIISGDLPEVKVELRIDLRFYYNDYYFKIYYEHELINNLAFQNDSRSYNNVIWFGFEKDLSSLISKY